MIDLLLDCPQFLEQVAKWCNAEWPEYFDSDVARAVLFQRTTLNRDVLPCTLVAHRDGRPVGTISLLEDDMDIRPEYSPWLASFFVAPAFRGMRGRNSIGRQLYLAGLKQARHMGLPQVYAWTQYLGRHLRRDNWQLVEKVHFQGKDVEVWKKDLY